MTKIIIIRGKSGAGKTTISHKLAEYLDNYIFLDIWKCKEMFEGHINKNRSETNNICKKAIFQLAREIIKLNKYNIILQETSITACKKYLKNYLDKIELYSFFLDVNLEDALKRNIKREKETMPKSHFIKQSKEKLTQAEKKDIIVDSSTNSISQIINKIFKYTSENKSDNNKIIRKTK